MDLGVVSTGASLIPMDDLQRQELATLPKNQPMMITVDTKRNAQNHKRFFAFLNTALDMQDHYTNINQLRFALMIKGGLCERVTSHKNGSVSFIPMSLKFDKMGEEKFRDTFKCCIDAFHEMLADMGRQMTENELYQIMDFE